MQILIVALLPKDLEAEICGLSRKYHPHLFAAKELPPHFTLVPPILIKSTISAFRVSLRETIRKIESFLITIDGIGTFENRKNVIFYRVINSADLNHLHSQINDCLNDLVDQRSVSKLPFHPHITFAKKMTDNNLQRIKIELKDFRPYHKFNLKTIGIFAMAEKGKFWRLIEKIELT